jgi:glycosyltransferase involved in cell wall biosynthesis
MRRELRELRDALRLSDAAHLLGQREDVPEVLAAMDVFVFPTLGADINSQAVSQAMAMGIPVAASAIPGNLEQASDGETALLFPPGDAGRLADVVCRLLEDPQLRQALAARARERVRSGYTLETMLDRMDDIYRTQAGRG